MEYERRFARTLAVIGASCVLSPILAFGAPQNPPSAPVTVVNGSSNPVPVQGSVGISGTVTVGNTDQNPVSVTGAVISGEKTVLLSDDFYSVASTFSATTVGPIDVQDYKNVRVVLRMSSCSNCGTGPIGFVQTVGSATTEPRTIDRLPITNPDVDIGQWASNSYDVVGTQLVVKLLSDKTGASYTVRVMVFGRAN